MASGQATNTCFTRLDWHWQEPCDRTRRVGAMVHEVMSHDQTTAGITPSFIRTASHLIQLTQQWNTKHRISTLCSVLVVDKPLPYLLQFYEKLCKITTVKCVLANYATRGTIIYIFLEGKEECECECEAKETLRSNMTGVLATVTKFASSPSESEFATSTSSFSKSASRTFRPSETASRTLRTSSASRSSWLTAYTTPANSNQCRYIQAPPPAYLTNSTA